MSYKAFPNSLAFGFLELSRLHGVPIGGVHCDQQSDSHASLRILNEDHSKVLLFVQMYRLPDGEQKYESDLALQLDDMDWEEPLLGGPLRLDIFPRDWSHRAFQISPRQILHRYRGADRATFIRYTGQSLNDPLLTQFNSSVRYLPDKWETDQAGKWFSVHRTEDEVEPATIDSLDLREEERLIREMFLDAVRRFANEQETPGKKLYQIPVTGIVLWHDFGNSYSSVHFDVHDPFGSGNHYSHAEYASLTRDEWGLFYSHSLDGNAVTLTGLNGKKIEIPSGKSERIDAAFDAMLTNLIKQLTLENDFAPLLRTANMQIHLETE